MIVAPLAMFYSYGDSTKDLQLTAPGIFGLFAFVGLITLLSFPVLLDFFKNYFNFTGKWCKILAGSAYTAYIIHPFFVVSMTGAFQNIYNANNAEDAQIEFVDHGAHNTTTSDSVLANDQAWLWPGWIITCTVATTTTWFVAHWIRELVPGAKKIL
jgi:hypothetical protein